jgi:hypothetical protein
MKNLLKTGALALFLALASCSGDDNESTNNNNNNANGSISATINGEEWDAQATSVTIIRIAQMGQQRFDITAEDDAQRIQIACSSEYTATGMPVRAYTFDEEDFEADALFTNSYLLGGNSYMEHFPQDGTVTITSVNTSSKKISGTFSFTAYKVGALQDEIVTPEEVIVTNGVFTNLKYTEYNQ